MRRVDSVCDKSAATEERDSNGCSGAVRRERWSRLRRRIALRSRVGALSRREMVRRGIMAAGPSEVAAISRRESGMAAGMDIIPRRWRSVSSAANSISGAGREGAIDSPCDKPAAAVGERSLSFWERAERMRVMAWSVYSIRSSRVGKSR